MYRNSGEGGEDAPSGIRHRLVWLVFQLNCYNGFKIEFCGSNSLDTHAGKILYTAKHKEYPLIEGFSIYIECNVITLP